MEDEVAALDGGQGFGTQEAVGVGDDGGFHGGRLAGNGWVVSAVESPGQEHERRITGFDDQVIAMYARGVTVREIRAFLPEQYGTDVSHDFIWIPSSRCLLRIPPRCRPT